MVNVIIVKKNLNIIDIKKKTMFVKNIYFIKRVVQVKISLICFTGSLSVTIYSLIQKDWFSTVIGLILIWITVNMLEMDISQTMYRIKKR